MFYRQIKITSQTGQKERISEMDVEKWTRLKEAIRGEEEGMD